MKLPDLNDPDLGRLLSLVVFLFALAIVFLVLSLPFSKNGDASGVAIGALATLIGGIVAARARNRSRGGGDGG